MRRFSALLLVLAAACSGASKREAWKDRVAVAVLPLHNHSNDLQAPGVVGKILLGELSSRGWKLIPEDAVDRGLKELGISDTGQLPAFTVEDIKRAIPADAYLIGDLLEYELKSLGLLTQRRVEVRLKWVDARTGEKVWEGTDYGVNSQAGPEALAHLGMGLVGKVVSGVKDSTKKAAETVVPTETGKKMVRRVGKATDALDEVSNYDLRDEAREAILKLTSRIEREVLRKEGPRSGALIP